MAILDYTRDVQEVVLVVAVGELTGVGDSQVASIARVLVIYHVASVSLAQDFRVLAPVDFSGAGLTRADVTLEESVPARYYRHIRWLERKDLWR